MFGSLLKVVLAPVDIAAGVAKDAVDVVNFDSKKSFGSETGKSVDRLGRNFSDVFDPFK
jgi:hypothetical protein